MITTCTRTLLAALAALTLLAAPAQADPVGKPHIVPGVVTKAEFDSVTQWERHRDVRLTYGAPEHFLVAWWGQRGCYHAAFSYPAENGTRTDAVYRDCNDNGIEHLVRKNWYEPQP